MPRNLSILCGALAAVILLTVGVSYCHASPPDLVGYLKEGQLEEGGQALAAHLEEQPGDAEAQYGLGIIHFLQAVEGLAQEMHRYGLVESSPRLPFVRLPVPENPNPERLTYEDWRRLLQRFSDDLDVAAKELAKVEDPNVKLHVPVGLIRLDIDGDGTVDEDETFWKVFVRVARPNLRATAEQKEFVIGFDKADVHWMIGYTHLLRAMTEAWLAHDTEDFFDLTAPVFFAGADRPQVTLDSGETQDFFDPDVIADVIAAIHLARFEVVEPERMSRVRKHLLSMIAESRLCWKHALAEKDDDREWIPNAQQTSLTPLTVGEEQIVAWGAFLDDAESALNGEVLLPHWRVQDDLGINLKRVFEHPRTFDLVLWVHGAAAVPYLEEGDVITEESANSLTNAFRGRFFGFAVWFN